VVLFIPSFNNFIDLLWTHLGLHQMSYYIKCVTISHVLQHYFHVFTNMIQSSKVETWEFYFEWLHITWLAKIWLHINHVLTSLMNFHITFHEVLQSIFNNLLMCFVPMVFDLQLCCMLCCIQPIQRFNKDHVTFISDFNDNWKNIGMLTFYFNASSHGWCACKNLNLVGLLILIIWQINNKRP
jgi:hypothetical protein